jgi:Phage gp6-like head-tail connector protein
MHSILDIISEDPDSAGPDLVGLDDLKLALGIEGTADDAALQAAITFQSRIIAEYCNRRFGLAQAVETFTFDRYEDMLRRQALTLSLYPVVEVTEVLSAGTGATDYSFDPVSGRLWMANGYCWVDTVSVSYSGGYDLPEEAPARLQRAVIDAVNAGRTSSYRDPTIREVQHGDARVSYFTPSVSSTTGSSDFLSAAAAELIKPFRRLHVA